MRVAFFANTSGMYGANRSLLNLVLGLRPLGVTPLVILPGPGRFSEELVRNGVECGLVSLEWWMSPQKSRLRALKRFAINASRTPKVAGQVRAFGADIVYSNTSVTPLGLMVAHRAQLPHVWHFREFCDLDYGLIPDVGWPLFRRIVRKSVARIAISKAVRRHLLRSDAERDAILVYNGVATQDEVLDRGTYRRVGLTLGSAYSFLLIGLVRHSKGQETALRALALVRQRGADARLVIAGDGEPDYVSVLRKLSSELGISDAVDFVGYLENPNEAYKSCDAVLMCSPNEALGRVTAEAMSFGRPVIGCESGGTLEILEPGITGLFYDGTVESLAARMHQLATQPEAGWEMGARGWQAALERFTIERCSRSVYNVLSSIAR